MKTSLVFVYLVLTLILTTMIFVFIDNSKNIFIPTLKSQLTEKGNATLLISLAVSLVIVLFFIMFKAVIKINFNKR
tara:strand:- start:4220 stop:4447 length:228 start_codon:yes stop_codon:yes gene_type:complete